MPQLFKNELPKKPNQPWFPLVGLYAASVT